MCLGPEIALVASIIGGASAVAGTAYSMVQGQKAAAASKRAERLREQQMRMESRRKQIEAIRKMQINRAASISNIQGGTGTLENSAYGGATSALSSNLGAQLGEISQATEIGSQMFAANAAYSQASANAQTGEGLASFGKSLFGSSQEIGRIGASIFDKG